MLDQQKIIAEICIIVHDLSMKSSLPLQYCQNLQDLEKHLVQSQGSLEAGIGSWETKNYGQLFV